MTAPTALVAGTAAGLVRVTITQKDGWTGEPRILVIDLPRENALRLAALLVATVAALEEGE